MKEKTIINVRNVDKELYHQAKVAALQANKSIGEWLSEAIRCYLKK